MSADKFFDSEESKEQYLKAEQEVMNGTAQEESAWDAIKAILKSFLPTANAES